jgi:hypothetical protein
VRRRPLLRGLARIGVVGVICTVVALIAVQYARIVEKNVWYARQLGDVRRDVAALERKREQQLREIVRLSDPQGAIPEIHDRLHLVGSHEAIIYVARPHE